MILIADSGAFKTDWAILSSDDNIQFQTIGLHPYFIAPEIVHAKLEEVDPIKNVKNQISKVFFYGAGCNSEKDKSVLYQILKEIFPEAELQIDSDLLGAAKALFKNNSGIACILGTGSNCCFYDGEKITNKTPSLGYILGDEGSGAYMGKILLRKYFYNQLPANLENQLKTAYQLTQDKILHAVYNNAFPNRYIAQFSQFLNDYKNEKTISNIIDHSIEEFFINHVLNLSEYKQNSIRFSGSIAWLFKDFITSISKKYNLSVDYIIQSPMQGLIDFHREDEA